MRIFNFAIRRLIKVKEAADRLSLAVNTIYNHKGGTEKLTRVKMGRGVRLIESEVEALVEEKIREAR